MRNDQSIRAESAESRIRIFVLLFEFIDPCLLSHLPLFLSRSRAIALNEIWLENVTREEKKRRKIKEKEERYHVHNDENIFSR